MLVLWKEISLRKYTNNLYVWVFILKDVTDKYQHHCFSKLNSFWQEYRVFQIYFRLGPLQNQLK